MEILRKILPPKAIRAAKKRLRPILSPRKARKAAIRAFNIKLAKNRDSLNLPSRFAFVPPITESMAAKTARDR